MNRMLSFGVLAMLAAVGAAQAGEQARFHLPFEARWGGVVLAPGDYKVSLPETSLGVPQFILKGTDRDKYIQPLVTDYDGGFRRDASRSYLQLVKVNGTYFVAKYCSGPTGKTFNFATPKHKRQVQMADQEAVEVAVAGN
jgi:hypothetical protein